MRTFDTRVGPASSGCLSSLLLLHCPPPPPPSFRTARTRPTNLFTVPPPCVSRVERPEFPHLHPFSRQQFFCFPSHPPFVPSLAVLRVAEKPPTASSISSGHQPTLFLRHSSENSQEECPQETSPPLAVRAVPPLAQSFTPPFPASSK